jgi:nitrite reductase/ring-hydroxylating ferredoxin subunit
MPDWVTVASTATLGQGEMIAVTLGRRELAIYNIDGEFYATDNLCTHALAYLTDGFLEGDEVECPLHGGRFKVRTGEGLGPPITCDIRTYPVRVVGADIQVDVAADVKP